LIGCIRQVLVVGIIAPTAMIGSMAVHLSRFPELQQQLREQPRLVPAAVEELLRLYTPYRGFARTATRVIERGGRTIRPAEPIALVYASANRDQAKFPHADRFELGRPNLSDHVAFGRGPHACPGAPLGRLQLCIALEQLLARTRSFALAGPMVPMRCPEIGALRVPLTFARA
jgi:cytochrome P450